MTETEVIVWRRRGCRCVLLRVFLSGQGWRVVFPDFAGSLPNDSGIIIAGEPAYGDGDASHRWFRFRKSGSAAEWHLSLDRSTWPPAGDHPVGVVYAGDPRPSYMSVDVACAHGASSGLTGLFLIDVETVVSTRRRVDRVIAT